MGRGGGLPLGALNLDDTQREQVRVLTQQYREQNGTVAERLRAALDAQRKAVEAVPFNEPLIRSTAQALAEAQTEMAVQRSRFQSEVFALLTPEQQARAATLRTQREARARQGQERRQQRQQQRQSR